LFAQYNDPFENLVFLKKKTDIDIGIAELILNTTTMNDLDVFKKYLKSLEYDWPV